MKVRFLFLCGLLCSGVVAAKEDARTKADGVATFEEAVLAAQGNNTGLQISQTDVKIAEERHHASKMAFLPSVNAQLQRSRSKQFSNYNENFSTGTRIAVEASVNVFNGLSTLHNMQAAESAEKAAYHKAKSEEQSLVVKVGDAYCGVWVGRQKIVALKKKEENLKLTFESQKSTLEAGAGTTPEVRHAEANYQRAVFERIRAEAELFSAESEFKKLTGVDAAQELMLPDFDEDIPDDMNNLINVAMASNHAILQHRYAEIAADNELKAARGKLSPSCEVSASTGRNVSQDNRPPQNGAPNVDTSSGSNTHSASLTVRVPIYNSGTPSEIEIAGQNSTKARLSKRDAISEVRKECVINFNTYLASKAMIKACRSAVKSAEISSASNLEENAMGMKSNTEVWVKENQLLDSRVGLVDSIKQKVTTALKLLALSGKLDCNYIVGKNKSSGKPMKNKTKEGKSPSKS
ncbi:MAG: TolC family protein [Holosporaceae bacterium]|jgi:adhesin transport system outer membrane protein|nr:TolC family protein [Holosporaceae bacterium]